MGSNNSTTPFVKAVVLVLLLTTLLEVASSSRPSEDTKQRLWSRFSPMFYRHPSSSVIRSGSANVVSRRLVPCGPNPLHNR
ncbi:hypothetical protein MLD38_015668 [Melastoma candidum]|uniref:Uncharacterized protein n=1 Tax=Melastoma candidum TaxID=119954 RepID=A0ACB9RGY1_9MYRT|nr:hypothetical protein MLD38_015668 [Melastoma candidum]